MGAIASQITSVTIVYSTDYSGAYQSKHQCSVSLAFVRGIHRGPVNSPHKWPVTRKMFPFDDVIMSLSPACPLTDTRTTQIIDQRDPQNDSTIYNLSSPNIQFMVVLTELKWTIHVLSRFQRNVDWNTAIFLNEKQFGNIVCKMVAMLSGSQCADYQIYHRGKAFAAWHGPPKDSITREQARQ